ncbi:MAG: hypothetical protein KKG09_06695 [Verrucomicrobia bacterium]|nr:hypothetical protein [Verrucomicrobiota bacterium]MBU4247793.1 hypothetical protein [Verrucomicrobiota bacterium]MBU4292081.1 hypothetical protein [Verrucomicrobiota bacterium]MBU4428913.1 hypothetical protein [Verrucomicrobiota bacterium]MBU4497671.1 hypothetical protein [Verrucomicrobiota bacterium]
MDAVGRHTCLRQGYGGQGMAAQAPASRVTLDKSYAGLQKKCDQSKKLLQEWSGLTGNTPILKDCSLLEVASVLSQCRGYAGNDSGISHLAAAVGIPTVALFGPTDPEVWGPRGTKVSILRGRPPTTKGLARIPEDDVFQRLQILMKSDRRPESAATGGNCGDLRSP